MFVALDLPEVGEGERKRPTVQACRLPESWERAAEREIASNEKLETFRCSTVKSNDIFLRHLYSHLLNHREGKTCSLP